MTEEQILQRFEAQRDMYRATLGGQKTRGLDMVVVPPPDTAPATVPVAEAARGDTTQAAAQAAGETVTFGQFAPELQVNVAIRFAFDSASIAPDQRPALEKMCSVMRQSDIALFRIVGHTDALGSDSYNENLSRLRAEEVRRWLMRDCGIAASRLEALGMGKRFLANPVEPAAAENRRVEFQALS
ncbi:OmpA family protein [uncultured Paracoccus sp.]|uniref:OmpA family protein n=1 Tax=uncultured Paracoccus sp. TaxID=189685 RepID=UPI002616B894|nr:OmpA family protein [uncultured Paracoccus sp.]